MSSKLVMRGMIGFYVFLFFAYLFGPLLVMSITAFNTPSYPQAYPFEAFTLEWFVKLWNHRAMMDGIKNSIIIGLGVVAISVPVGLAAAIMMGQIYHRARSVFYLVTVSPVLTPGVIIGISTVIFWKDMMGLTDFTKAYFYKGIILAIFGQASFVAAYCLLIIMARLQRFDRSQEEAALDLGRELPAGLLAYPRAVPEARLDFSLGDCLPFLVRELQHHNLCNPGGQNPCHGSGR